MKDMSKFSSFARTVLEQKYAHQRGGSKETWSQVAQRVAKNVLGVVNCGDEIIQEVADIIEQRKFMPGGRYLAAAGRPYHQTQNCFLFRVEDSREGWSELLYKSAMSLMSGGGIGCNYSLLRPEGAPIKKTGGTASGPLALMQMVNESGRFIRQGGDRRAAIWAGLSWQHADILKFIDLKDWTPEVSDMKKRDFNFPAPMDCTNVSVGLDDEFFDAFHHSRHKLHERATEVYWLTLEHMLRTGEPGFLIDTGKNAGEDLRNACTEVSSVDDSDVCNLGSVNMARIVSLDEMKRVVELATIFLLAGTVYSDLPFEEMEIVRTKNRRLGLGLMGLHEWLLVHGYQYGQCDELKGYLDLYRDISDETAEKQAKKWKLSVPVKRRAIAPTGTIGIVAETTTGIEPIFCVAYKRRYLDGKEWKYQYVVDPTAKRLIDEMKIEPEKIEDALVLAGDVERRVAFQAWVQGWVDHGISSTINLPSWDSELNNSKKMKLFGEMLIKYLPKLRGFTVYPDGARGGQPLTPVKYETAMKHEGEVFLEMADVCRISGKGGSCGE